MGRPRKHTGAVPFVVQEGGQSSPEFEKLLNKLACYIKEATGNAVEREGRRRIDHIINEAGMVYDGTTYWASEDARNPRNLCEIKEPLNLVIELLSNEGTRRDVLRALGVPANPNQKVVERALKRYETLLRDLDRIARSLPPPPKKRGRGKPSKTKDLQELVRALALFWERETRLPFKQYWTQRETKGRNAGRRSPQPLSARFVGDLVDFIDSSRHDEQKSVMEDVVTELRRRRSVSR